MKTPLDPRHQRRRKIIQSLFPLGFKEGRIKDKFALEINKNREEIDDWIKRCAPEWPIDQINKADLAILRLAIFELKILKKEPPKVIIDEAVELAKEFGSESSPSFVNGVLGTAMEENGK